jgi:F420-non-reducing hydrogenase iron-sulfur subunit
VALANRPWNASFEKKGGISNAYRACSLRSEAGAKNGLVGVDGSVTCQSLIGAISNKGEAIFMGDCFEPKIIGFLCNWCSYAGADMTGTSRIPYPHNIRIIRVPCSGRVDPLYVLKAFQEGADGVLVAGCHPGDCHYGDGNYHARRRYALMHSLLDFVGIEAKRLRIDWVSAAEGNRFAQVVTELTEQVRELGPWTGFGQSAFG